MLGAGKATGRIRMAAVRMLENLRCKEAARERHLYRLLLLRFVG
jgi:hypothetical protein